MLPSAFQPAGVVTEPAPLVAGFIPMTSRTLPTEPDRIAVVGHVGAMVVGVPVAV
jgi:hypothetical protein